MFSLFQLLLESSFEGLIMWTALSYNHSIAMFMKLAHGVLKVDLLFELQLDKHSHIAGS